MTSLSCGELPIVGPDGVTAPWLTAALAQRGVDAYVARLRMETVGTGQVGETRRYFIEYAGTPAPGAPASVVGKFSSLDATARETGRQLGLYRTEVMFYRHLAAHAGIRTPLVYAAEIDPASHDFVLLFEDLAPARQGDQMRGCTLAEARAALSEAARLHAAFWNDRRLLDTDWCTVPDGAQGFYTTALIEQSWAHVRKHYADWLPADVRTVCAKFVRNHAWWNRPRDFPKCFSHNDFRPDNMLFGPAGARVAVVDWQTASFLGTGMDVAYFLGGALPRATRRRHEATLLRDYHAQLLALGVTDYPFEHLMNDYRHYSFAAIAVAIAATLIVKRTERGDRMLMQMTRAAAEHAADLDALDLLPD
ncbi:MAG: phosphotransferase [Gammaproteobacteria bacterium]|uniref:phosphotransferase n=1 Tax=Bradyrhizobium sp. TaxID=376 RepID=UPI003D110A93